MTPDPRAFERAEDDLERAFTEGSLSREDYADEMRYLAAEYRAAAEEAAQDAYDAERERW